MRKYITRFSKYMSRFFIFGNLSRPIKPFRVNLLYWRPHKGDNVGDYLSKVVFRWCLNQFHLRQFNFATKRICVIGSVLSFIGGGKTTVWGTGLMSSESVSALLNPLKKVKLDIRAVRGPKTRAVLLKNGIACPEIYGDPAILMPLIYHPIVDKIIGKILIIPHNSLLHKYSKNYSNVVDTYTSDYKWFIREILSSEKVISSSLHGLILAESYGVPAVFLNDYPGSRFKYDDYYESTGRHSFPIADSIEEALSMSGQTNKRIDIMQHELLNAFPIDILKIKSHHKA